ncbi:hypothetical protein Dda_4594 [Drechslerella dactyloides]|uniref:Target of rapamycin complex subunit LST8 n=1 Tax=Drechslerella dactyloides TaxID=74499 RepID=A0AAD6IX93_DREDA|nr:hypothetical protein Dda_4594 [Drechslerella dactyloides]
MARNSSRKISPPGQHYRSMDRSGEDRQQHYQEHHGQDQQQTARPVPRRLLAPRGGRQLAAGIASVHACVVGVRQDAVDHMPLLVDHGAEVPEDLIQLHDAVFDVADLLLALLDHGLLKVDFGLRGELQLRGLLLDQRHGFAGIRGGGGAMAVDCVEGGAGLDYVLPLLFDAEFLDGLEVRDRGGEFTGELLLYEALLGLWVSPFVAFVSLVLHESGGRVAGGTYADVLPELHPLDALADLLEAFAGLGEEVLQPVAGLLGVLLGAEQAEDVVCLGDVGGQVEEAGGEGLRQAVELRVVAVAGLPGGCRLRLERGETGERHFRGGGRGSLRAGAVSSRMGGRLRERTRDDESERRWRPGGSDVMLRAWRRPGIESPEPGGSEEKRRPEAAEASVARMSVIMCTAGYDHTIRFWEALSGICSRTIQHADSQVNRLCISPDKRFLAAAGHLNVKLYDIKSTNPAPVLSFEGHTNNVTGVGFHCEGKWMVTSSEDGTVKIWDTRTASVQRNYSHGSPVNDVVIHPNQGELISCDQAGNVRIWDLGENKCTHQLIPEDDVPVRSVTVATDGSMLVAGNNTGNCYVWRMIQNRDLTSLVPVTKFQAHTKYITRVLLSPDVRHLATCSADHTAKIWSVDPQQFSLETTLHGHQRWVWDCAFSADSAYLVTACSDHFARLWELSTQSIIRQYNGHHRGAVCVALNDYSER